ncbi:MAG: hypothetical protein Roseis2KO_40860 [Roseivirga sp.]
MKTQITKIIAAALLLTAGTTLNATNGPAEKSIKVSTENQKAVVLQLDNLSSGTEVSLKNKQGAILFQDEVNEAEYAKVFNLKSLEEGDIYLEIESDEQLEVLTIKVTDTQAYLEKSSELIIEKAIVKMQGDIAKVFFGNNEGQTKVTLFDEANDIVYRHNADNGGSKSYDLSDLAEGAYTFQFKSGGKTFYHRITVK